MDRGGKEHGQVWTGVWTEVDKNVVRVGQVMDMAGCELGQRMDRSLERDGYGLVKGGQRSGQEWI